MRSYTRLAVAVQLLGLSVALPDNAPVEIESRASDTYDYVIVGGGVTGLIVANRLTEDKKSELRSLKKLVATE
jgi:hypothetical protein